MKPTLKQVLVPTLSQTAISLGLSLLLVVVFYKDQILHRLGINGGAFTGIDYGDSLQKVAQSPIIHTVVIVGFWSAVGLVAYTVVWSLINALIEARNEVVLETEYTNKAAFAERVKVPLLQLGLAAVLFAGLIVCAKLVFPALLTLAFHGLKAQSWQIAAYLLASIFGIALAIYILILLGQLVFWVG